MSDSPFGELLGVNHLGAVQFFFDGLKDVVPSELRKEDIKYPASILAHYSQVSCLSNEGFPCPKDLRDVYNNFVDPNGLMSVTASFDTAICEVAGGQCLLLAGFFRSQMRNRHNVSWYTKIGMGFYVRAAERTFDREREAKMSQMSEQFPMWADACFKLSLELRDRPFLLQSRKAS